MAGEMLEQENVLQKCVRQLEGAEATRVSLVSLLKEAIQDQVCSCFVVFDVIVLF